MKYSASLAHDTYTCSNLRVYDRDCQCKSGSTKRIPKRVRLTVSRTSRTDEAAEPHRLGSPPSRSVEKGSKGALDHFFFAQQNASLPRNHAQNDAFGHPNRARLNRIRDSRTRSWFVQSYNLTFTPRVSGCRMSLTDTKARRIADPEGPRCTCMRGEIRISVRTEGRCARYGAFSNRGV